MKTFTVRELDRAPATVLAAAQRDGAARIRSRDGKSYTIRPEAPTAPAKLDWPAFVQAHREWRRKVYPRPLAWTKKKTAEFDELIASHGRVL